MFLQEQLKGIIIAFIFVFCTCVGIWTSDISVSVLGSRLMEDKDFGKSTDDDDDAF